jgi:hypothetical protein
VLEQEELTQSTSSTSSSTATSNKECVILKLLFNLIERPDAEQRSIILAACSQFTRHAGPMYVNNHLLPLCWEQLSARVDEKRMLVAEACSTLAPHIYNDIRTSLMFSILKQIVEQESGGSESTVRVCSVKSLATLVNYMRDEQKFAQCVELLDLCATDSSVAVVRQVQTLLMPSVSLWAISFTNTTSGRPSQTTDKQFESLMDHLAERAEFHMLASLKQRLAFARKNEPSETSFSTDHEQHAKTYLELINLNLQFVYSYILVHFREQQHDDEDDEDVAEIVDEEDEVVKIKSSSASVSSGKLAKLNEYYHLLQAKLGVTIELYKVESVLEDYLSLSKRYLSLIETDSWSSVQLSNAFEWLSDKFLRRLIQMSAQLDAKDYLCPDFVLIFRNFTLLFAIDHEFVKSKVGYL